MRVQKQQIIVTRVIKEMHDVDLSYKFKSLLANPNTTAEQVKAALYPNRLSRTRKLDDLGLTDLPQDKSEDPVVTIDIVVTYVDGGIEQLEVWNSISGFNKEGYELAKAKGEKLEVLQASQAYLTNE